MLREELPTLNYNNLKSPSSAVQTLTLSSALNAYPKKAKPSSETRLTSSQVAKDSTKATAAARLGAKSTFIGRIGDDPYAEVLRSSMETEKMDTQHVKTDAESGTGIATIIVQLMETTASSSCHAPTCKSQQQI